MIPKRILIIVILVVMSELAFSQSASIRGVVRDEYGKPIKNSNVYLYSEKYHVDSTCTKLFDKYYLVSGSASDENGNYFISPVPPEKFYIVAVKYAYSIPDLMELLLQRNGTTYYDFVLKKVTDSLELRNIPYNIYK